MNNQLFLAESLIHEFKGEDYMFGLGVLNYAHDHISDLLSTVNKRVLIVGRLHSEWCIPYLDDLKRNLLQTGIDVIKVVPGAKPNAPKEDVFRIFSEIRQTSPDLVIVMDSGSGIDAVKAAAVLASVNDEFKDLEHFFGVNKVTAIFEQTQAKMLPVFAIMTAASSGAHLTKYSNITDLEKGQKKLIVDDIIIPPKALFDYKISASQPTTLTLDGALDGISHLLEVYYGAAPGQQSKAKQLVEVGLDLILDGLIEYTKNPDSLESREKLGLGTDLGAYAIMIGGTSGPHLNSFSLINVLSHGRACALMNPYYTVFFAPAIEDKLRVVGEIYKKHGFIEVNLDKLRNRELGLAVAEGMVNFGKFIRFPTTLSQVPGITQEDIKRCLNAAKDPQLEMKLRNMPVPLNAGMVDEYMGPILQAALDGDFGHIKNL
jgi:alcohol dehydrogenase